MNSGGVRGRPDMGRGKNDGMMAVEVRGGKKRRLHDLQKMSLLVASLE